MSWFLPLAAENEAAAVVGLQVAEVFHAERLAELLCGVKPGREEARVELGTLLTRELQPQLQPQNVTLQVGDKVRLIG